MLESCFPIIHKRRQVIQYRPMLFQLKIIFSKELQSVINQIDMKKCGLRLTLFIVVLMVASQFMKDEEGVNENMTMVMEVQKRNINKP